MSTTADPSFATTEAPAGRFARARLLARGWPLFLLRGVFALIFGVAALLLPGLGLAVILGVLAAWMVLDGIATLTHAARGGGERGRVWLWLDGILSLVAAAVLLLLPGPSALVLVLVVGFWSVFVGVMRLVSALRGGSVLMGLFGALSVLVGAWLIVAPGPGLLALVWVVALQALIAGGVLLGLGWRLRRIAHDPHGPDAAPAR